MRGKRVKWIKDLVVGDDPSLLLTVRNYYGNQTEKFNDSKVYRKAKELYSRCVPEVKDWGKVFKNLSSMKVEKPIVKEEVSNVINNDNPVI
jgi:hypothetical protein